MINTCSAFTRRAARPWHRRNLPPPARPERRAPRATLTVRLGNVSHVAPILAALLANLNAGGGR